MKDINSDISGFYKLSIEKRHQLLSKYFEFDSEEKGILDNFGYFSSKQIDTLIENVISSFTQHKCLCSFSS